MTTPVNSAQDGPRDDGPSPWLARPVVAARTGLLAIVALAPVAGLAGGLLAGREGAVGALLGALVPVTVLLITWLAAEVGARRSATAFAGLLMGSYLVKLVAVGVVLALVRDVDGSSRTALGLSAVVGLMVALVVEAKVITSTRAPYVEP